MRRGLPEAVAGEVEEEEEAEEEAEVAEVRGVVSYLRGRFLMRFQSRGQLV